MNFLPLWVWRHRRRPVLTLPLTIYSSVSKQASKLTLLINNGYILSQLNCIQDIQLHLVKKIKLKLLVLENKSKRPNLLCQSTKFFSRTWTAFWLVRAAEGRLITPLSMDQWTSLTSVFWQANFRLRSISVVCPS